jgi:hypothetical protein
MKKRTYYCQSIKRSLLVVALFIYVLSIYECGAILDENQPDHCDVDINEPSNTVYSAGENVTFSAHLENWEYPDAKSSDKRGILKGVQWVSNIDGILSEQEYTGFLMEANPSFSTDNLSAGNHTIKCHITTAFGESECYDQIYIEIIETNDIRYPNCRIKIFTIDYYESSVGGDTSINQSTYWGTANGTWEDTVFTAVISEQDALNNISGRIEVTIDSKQQNVLSFYGKETATGISSDYERLHLCEGTGPIPIFYCDDNSVSFVIRGENILSVLDTYSDIASGTANGSLWFKNLIDFSINNDSEIVIEFDQFE